MPIVFFLVDGPGPSGAARQLGLLAAALPPDRFRVEVGVLAAADAPIAQTLRTTGLRVHALPLRHLIDVGGWRRVRQTVAAARPAVIHAWGPAAVRISRLLTQSAADGGNSPRLVASSAAIRGGVLGWLTARQLRRADRVVASTRAEAERYRQLGVPSDRLSWIHPAVAAAPPPPDPMAFRRDLGLPPHARLIVALGGGDSLAGLKAAIWAFDMLRYEAPDLHLVIVGAGPHRTPLEEFGRAVAFDDFRVTFAAPRPDLPAVLGLAEVVWVTHGRGGVNVSLEAMAAGRPVVAWRTPELSELIEDGESGFLVSPSERPQIAAKTHALLADSALGTRVGAAAKARAACVFSVERIVRQFAPLYGELAGM